MDDTVYLSPEQACELLVMLGTGDEGTIPLAPGRYGLVPLALPSGDLVLTLTYVVGDTAVVWNGVRWELDGGRGGSRPTGDPEEAA